MKLCSRCNRLKPIDCFGFEAKRKDGRQLSCLTCNRKYMKEYRLRNHEKFLRKEAEWRKLNLDVARQTHKKFMNRNPGKDSEYGKAYRSRFPERRKETCLKYREKNKDKEKIYRKEYAAKNQGKLNAKAAKRHAGKMQATPPWANLKEIEKIYEKARRLTVTTGIPHHVDHIFPLKSKVLCGLHVPVNLRVLEGTENLSKRNRLPPKYIWHGIVGESKNVVRV